MGDCGGAEGAENSGGGGNAPEFLTSVNCGGG